METNCSTCHGSGIIRCGVCAGSGQVGSRRCRLCNGRGTVKCPSCSGTVFGGMSKYSVEWSESKRQFSVSLILPNRPSYNAFETALRELPHHIAETSYCACGSTLSVGDHSLKLQGSEIEFVGSFMCKKCTGTGQPVLHRMRKRIAVIWGQLAKVKVGPSGIEIQKKPRG
jgi:RecJ-like exonuclease